MPDKQIAGLPFNSSIYTSVSEWRIEFKLYLQDLGDETWFPVVSQVCTLKYSHVF